MGARTAPTPPSRPSVSGARAAGYRAEIGFDDDTGLSPAGDSAWHGHVAPGWETPRGPLGGYVMAIVLRAMQEAVGDESRQPRSFTVHFLRPPHEGEVTVRPVLERAGRNLSTASARLEQDGKLIALALCAFSGPWPGPLLTEGTMPDVQPPDPDRPPPLAPDPDRPAPSFVEQVTMQPRFGEAMFSGAEQGLAGGWLALQEARPIDALTLCVLADLWFPAPWPRLDALAPAPTIDLTVHFRAPLPLDDVELLGRFRSTQVRDGFFEEDGELWSPDGTLVAQSRQLGLLLVDQAQGAGG
ncbi:MAG: acyl-CoA thioesterase [Solirubrobacterales bacterium]